MNLHQLRIFCAIAQSKTLTQAAKQIGLTQPTLSQQLSSLEEKVGTKLFERTLNQMELTVAGEFLLRRALHILSEVEGAEEQLREFASGKRGVIRLAGINSIVRAVAPQAILMLRERLPEVEFDIHELAPTEVLDLLYARQINIGLVAVGSLPKSNVSFKEVPVVTDPYVLVTPAGLGLADLADPDDLAPERREILKNCISFAFASQWSRRLENWRHQMFPGHRQVAQCRSYDVALSFVRAGIGVCVAPALAVHEDGRSLEGVDLYATNLPARQTVALVPAQSLRIDPYKTFVDALREAGAATPLPRILPMPRFMTRAAELAELS
ncbi:LysR family transcriptional regulator [Rhodoblastus acidophilus]|uniref:LysR family transcriptional regulator n=1 Tax=Rhodoblastus acidophilus TaxID=1074 RepID=A0A6N8DHY8_RHOAC|nr:LysR family transcriptional regulator [Rhodoblastus acidophilus]MCW2272901.1 DNA-binding transcriptional LysR family regulator [Rhodoblastus acidophilus]MTV29808.1 LysR family transcriptional regulator [Rhodoblastus acidophilus]